MSGAMGGKSAKVNSSAQDGDDVTPSDSTDLNFDALYIGGTGDVVITNRSGKVVTYVGVSGGAFFPVSGVKVMLATDATNIVTAVW